MPASKVWKGLIGGIETCPDGYKHVAPSRCKLEQCMCDRCGAQIVLEEPEGKIEPEKVFDS